MLTNNSCPTGFILHLSKNSFQISSIVNTSAIINLPKNYKEPLSMPPSLSLRQAQLASADHVNVESEFPMYLGFWSPTDDDIENGFIFIHVELFNRCLNPPRTARRVESFIQECQEDVKNKLLNEAYLILKDEAYKDYSTLDMNNYNMNLGGNSGTIESLRRVIQEPSSVPMPSAPPYPTGSHRPSIRRLLHGIQRIAHDPTNAVYHPTLVSFQDKRIAGCLLHCIYARNNAIDKLGWPTLDGLVDFYSEGVNEHGFFMATLRSVNLCLHAITMKYRINRRKLPERGESCDLAFDVFDCISDQITGYCLDQYT